MLWRGRTLCTAFVLLLVFTVSAMHTGIGVASPHAPAAAHQVESADSADDADGDAHPASEDPDADHQFHDCIGPIGHDIVLAMPTVVVLALPDSTADNTDPGKTAAMARGPPPWTVLTLEELCLWRI